MNEAAEAKVKDLKEKAKAMDRLYSEVFDNERYAPILSDLDSLFSPLHLSMIRRDQNKAVDPYATLSAAGAGEVLIYIHRRIRNGRVVG